MSVERTAVELPFPRAELKRHPIGHFEVYVGEGWERAGGDQSEFLVRHLLARPAGGGGSG